MAHFCCYESGTPESLLAVSNVVGVRSGWGGTPDSLKLLRDTIEDM